MSSGDRRPDDEESAAPTTDRQQSSDTEAVDSPDRSRQSTEQSRQETQPTREYSAQTDSETLLRRFWTAEDGPLLLFREVLFSGGIVLLIGLLLFSVSGVWPPMVAVESESMEPNINQYDLIVVTEPGRFAPDVADQTGVVTADSVSESEHESFNRDGSVIVYDNPSTFGPPIIHRAHFYVEADENWYDRANPEYISADDCAELTHCPAPHAGYITKGDNNQSNAQYDQANGIAPVVRPGWVTGIARVRLPHVGYIRLALTGAASFGPIFPAGLSAMGAATAVAIGRRN